MAPPRSRDKASQLTIGKITVTGCLRDYSLDHLSNTNCTVRKYGSRYIRDHALDHLMVIKMKMHYSVGVHNSAAFA